MSHAFFSISSSNLIKPFARHVSWEYDLPSRITVIEGFGRKNETAKLHLKQVVTRRKHSPNIDLTIFKTGFSNSRVKTGTITST